MTQPRLLDLFCGAGGAARGYQDAGFYVVGVDIVEQPRYAGDDFIRADALAALADAVPAARPWRFDAIHASPPCQRYSAAAAIHDSSENHPDLVSASRWLLREIGRPHVIENVERAPLLNPAMLCGSMFGLGVRRHRLFESNMLLLTPTCGDHRNWHASVFGGRCLGRQRVTAMGIDWMTLEELSQAIPPAYTEFIGAQLLQSLAVVALKDGN